MKRGPVEYREGRQSFYFEDKWLIAKYDEASCHKKLNSAVSGSKAVDFCGLVDGVDAVYLIEVKDFRTHEAVNWNRVKPTTGDLAREVAQKVRDTLAGMIGAGRVEKGDWAKSAKRCGSVNTNLLIVLWLEVDGCGPADRHIKPMLDAHMQKLKESLRWAGARVMVVNEAVGADFVPNLRVHTIARP